MHPVLWESFGVRVPTYGVLLLVGFLLAVLLVRQRAPALGLDRDRMTVVAAQLTLAGTVGSRLWYVLAAPAAFEADPASVIALWNGGHVWYGALAGGLLAVAWHVHRTADLGTLADLYLPAASIAHGCGRVGCFAAGCCWGRPTSVAWAVRFPIDSLCAVPGMRVHPTQLYEAAGEGAISLLLVVLWRRRRLGGEVGLAYLGMYALLRLAVEPLRGDAGREVLAGTFSVAQGVSLLLLVAVAVAWSARRCQYRLLDVKEIRRCTTPSSPR
ncbi:MAG TPA: prolipoprotein diacylglyceryl transferase [Thermoanaerobaculia bacterium]|jgi:phosphatidylglycerol:prolipoprotein diacylglycerol transferase|nr:prolipoprotein diacylglyceryl transferase [Thermoanaerobaculia bacterium]